MNPGEFSYRLQLHLTGHRSVNDVGFHAPPGAVSDGEHGLLVGDFGRPRGDGPHPLVESVARIRCGRGDLNDGGRLVEQLALGATPLPPAFVDGRRVGRAERRDADDVIDFLAGNTGFTVALGSTDHDSPNVGRFTKFFHDRTRVPRRKG